MKRVDGKNTQLNKPQTTNKSYPGPVAPYDTRQENEVGPFYRSSAHNGFMRSWVWFSPNAMWTVESSHSRTCALDAKQYESGSSGLGSNAAS